VPTYEYRCTACGADHAIVQKMTDPTLTTCPSCGADELRKQFSGVGVMFKGSGFYRTDSRDSGTKTSGESKDATPAKSDSTSSTSSTPATSSPSSSSSSAPAAS
jgi:putative FmdB family regulatory protein